MVAGTADRGGAYEQRKQPGACDRPTTPRPIKFRTRFRGDADRGLGMAGRQVRRLIAFAVKTAAWLMVGGAPQANTGAERHTEPLQTGAEARTRRRPVRKKRDQFNACRLHWQADLVERIAAYVDN